MRGDFLHSRAESFHSIPSFDRPTAAPFHEHRPKGIMKRRDVDSKQKMLFVERPPKSGSWGSSGRAFSSSEGGESTTDRFETHKRTEEVERKVNRRNRSRHSRLHCHEGQWGQERRSVSMGPFDLHANNGYSTQPFVEYPPTLPRHPPTPLQYRHGSDFYGTHKTQSFEESASRYGSRWENDYHDSSMTARSEALQRLHRGGIGLKETRSVRRLRRVGPPYENSDYYLD
ncbi:hypothetical protein QR680_013261 [Steinernema hermaphroditum]|uniref:Uncharacterized protein n=1 Tax=Steinernema hermaphroditum TaxID=289476 RepID=A0AA39M205_9BILA|nr:hypothetical protein QR680_013261 [Steinernema hermaphroditum]